jgi:DNA-binding GntR family transcriptional regulator
MQPTERGVNPHINHIIENSGNFINFFTHKGHEKEQIEYSYFELERVFGARKASFINKLNYWLNKCGRNIEDSEAKWIYNTIKDWAEQFNWSVSTLKRIVYSLEEEGIITSKKINARKWNHTKWYSIDYNKLNSFLSVDKELRNYSDKKRANRLAQKEPIIISNTSNNHTNRSSYKESGMNLNNTSDKKLEEIKIDSNKKEIINKMLYVWNKVFECSVNPIKAYSNQKNQQTLLHLYKAAFNSDLDNWREYALKVNSSQFLMGEKKTRNNFKAVFSWLIKEETIEKIQNGEYGVGDRELDMNNVSKNIEEKKEEVVNKMDKKISEYMKLNIDETKERKEFDEYVKTYKAEVIDDEYNILGVIKHISYYSLFKTSEYEGLKESLYESYVMKKYLNITKVEARKRIRNKMKEMIVDKGETCMIFDELNKKGKVIEYLELTGNINKIDL